MDFTFVLPMSSSDLLNSSGDNYYVKQVYQDRDLADKMLECKRMLHRGDPFYIFDHFDTFFSIIDNNNTDDTALKNLMRSFDLLYLTVDKLGEQLASALSAADTLSVKDRKGYLNLTKMTMYLFVNTVRRIDSCVQRVQQQQQQNNLQKRRGKQTDLIEQHPDWEKKRSKFLVQLYNVMQCPLEKLWSPPIAEENFVNLLCEICYRSLEIVHLRPDTRHIVDTVFQIFGTAIKRYNHAMSFPVRVLQILRTVESAGLAVAAGIKLLYEEFNITSIFAMLIKEIVEALSLDSADTVVSRNFSHFLAELSTVAPKLMIPHISTLCEELLSCESHVLRNCVLQIMGDAIVGELTSEELSDELKEARDEFLENLLLHVNDVSAHVRCKVLSIWCHLKESDAVPLSFQLKVLCGAVERLEDKTSSVRKQAVQLIRAFLEHNPFAAKLSLEELIKEHTKECEKMEELRAVVDEERKKAEKLDEEWSLVVPDLQPIVEENLAQNTEDNYSTDEEYNDMVKRISDFLLQKKYKEAMVLVRKADYANAELKHTLKPEELCAYYMALLKSYVCLANGLKNSNDVFGTQIKTVQFWQDSIEFSKVITKAMPKIQEFLLSKTNSDVFEAVDLFTTGYMFGIKGTEGGMRQMLYLVWSSDKEKRDAVCEAYEKILFTTDQSGRAHAILVVQNLSRFLEIVEYGHYTALESLMCEWVKKNTVDAHIIQVLFERFTMKLEGTTPNDSRLALQLLIMCSNAKHTIALANINIIESIGLGERGKRDPRIYTGCLEFLLNSVDPLAGNKFYKRYEPDNPLVLKVISFFEGFFFHPRLPHFDKMAMKTFEFIYHMCQKPDIVCQNIVMSVLRRTRRFAVRLKQQSAVPSASQPMDEADVPYSQPIPETQSCTLPAEGGSELRLPVFLLTRFVFIIGFITLKEMIFLDIDVYNNMKYRQELTETEEKKKKKKAAAPHESLRKTTASLSLATPQSKRLSGANADQQEPEEDLVGATAEDNIAELINHICEEVLLKSDSALLAKLFPYLQEICKYPGKYRDPLLQQAAVLALIRFMCVSSDICEANMSFLMNILQKTTNIKIKCNIVVGLSDLTFRFPNIIEPWTGHFYSTLHESNTELRLTAVKMLSHLILHEMIRVKGQIADLAMCIVDSNDQIKNITQQFFKEIGNKSNMLYNVLPDIISKLGDTNLNLEEEKYRVIMRYILGLIQKDRQVETLVEKLCIRFPVTRDERQWRDIAYCLSLLTYNERSLKKLIDNSQYYKDKVQIDEVYQSFKLIIGNTSKLAKPELKAVVAELEARIEECLAVNEGGGGDGQPDDEAAESRRPKSASKTTTKKGRNRPAKGRPGRRGSSSSGSDFDSDSEPPRRAPATKGKPSQRKGDSSSESSGDDDEDGPPSAASKKASANSKNKSQASKRMPPPAATTPARPSARRSGRSQVIHETESSSEERTVPLPKRGRSARK